MRLSPALCSVQVTVFSVGALIQRTRHSPEEQGQLTPRSQEEPEEEEGPQVDQDMRHDK